jgi:hypothetical protein
MFVLVPLFVAIVEVLALVLLALAAVFLRIVVRRPWVVEAVSEHGERLAWQVIGRRTSGERCREAAQSIERVLPRADGPGSRDKRRQRGLTPLVTRPWKLR